jgi:hypothetical protein
MPGAPQVVVSGSQLFFGSVPFLIGPHTPEPPLAFFDPTHDSHAPSQIASQQTPSTQKPVLHSAVTVQAAPTGVWSTHAPPEHQKPPMHCAFVVHDVRHWPAWQEYGSHGVDDATHTPALSHKETVLDEPAHKLGPQEAPGSATD